MALVSGIARQHTILGNQASATLGEEDLVTELDGFEHLAPFDQIRMGFKNRVELLLRRNVLALQDAPAGLTDDPVPELAVPRNLPSKPLDDVPRWNVVGPLDDRPGLVDHLLGHPDEVAIRPHLVPWALLRRHAVDLLHPAPGPTRAVGEAPDRRRQSVCQVTNEPRQDPDRIPEQRAVGRMMNVGFDHGGVDRQLRAVLEAERDRGLDDRVIDGLQRGGREPVEGAIERVVLRHPLAIELSKVPQRVAVAIRSRSSR